MNIQTLPEGKYTFVVLRQHPFSNFKRTEAGKSKGISEAKSFWVSQYRTTARNLMP